MHGSRVRWLWKMKLTATTLVHEMSRRAHLFDGKRPGSQGRRKKFEAPEHSDKVRRDLERKRQDRRSRDRVDRNDGDR